MKEDMSLSNLGTVALHAAKVPTNVFSSTLICILTLDYIANMLTYINPLKPSVLFVGHRQTLQNQIRRRKTRRLIRFSTVCLKKVSFKI